MQRQFRTNRSDQPQQSDVLYEQRIDAGGGNDSDKGFDFCQFIGESECVECDIAFHTAMMQEAHRFGQFVGGNVGGPSPGVETAIQAEINRIRTIFDGGSHTVAISGRSQQLGSKRFRQSHSSANICKGHPSETERLIIPQRQEHVNWLG